MPIPKTISRTPRKKIFENPLAPFPAHNHHPQPARTKQLQTLGFSSRIILVHRTLPHLRQQPSTHPNHRSAPLTATLDSFKAPNHPPTHNALPSNAPLQQAFSAPHTTPPTPLNAGRYPPSAARAEFIQTTKKPRKFGFSPLPHRIDPRHPPELSSPVIAVEPRRQRGRTRGGRRLRSHGIPEGGSSIA
jgi:hypothetical protein